jgi:hypothetical protein
MPVVGIAFDHNNGEESGAFQPCQRERDDWGTLLYRCDSRQIVCSRTQLLGTLLHVRPPGLFERFIRAWTCPVHVDAPFPKKAGTRQQAPEQ